MTDQEQPAPQELPSNQTVVPLVTFLFTLDQIVALTNISMHDIKHKYLYYRGRSSGRKPRHQMVACNIAPDDEVPEWRVSYQDFLRWLNAQGWEITFDARL